MPLSLWTALAYDAAAGNKQWSKTMQSLFPAGSPVVMKGVPNPQHNIVETQNSPGLLSKLIMTQVFIATKI